MAILNRQFPRPLLLILGTIFYTLTSAHDEQPYQPKHLAAFGSLDIRQDTTTCPSGGICNLGNLCCGTGCMFSSGTCCPGSDSYFCYVGETCEGPNSVGDVQCCTSSGTCNPAKFVIFYATSSGSGSGSTSATAAATSSTAAAGVSQSSTGSAFTSPGTTTGVGSALQSSQIVATTATTAIMTSAGASVAGTSSPAMTSKSGSVRLNAGALGDRNILWVFILILSLTFLLA